MSDNWRQHTAEYMANEYKRDASEWKHKYDHLVYLVDALIKSMPTEQIVWYPDVDKRLKALIELLKKRSKT